MNNRKRKHNNSDSYLTNTYDDQNGDFNDTYASTATPAIPSESDEYSMWLVRKPKKVVAYLF
jgi:hypothetical protein